jgi:arylsulfatase A-like enzyme
MNSTALGCLAALLIAAVSAAGQHRSEATDPPNILLVTIDTLRADHLSCYGYHRKTSPNMDALAAQGVRFEHAYCTIPLTGPSHVSLFSSRYPQEHGVRINGVPIPKDSKWLYLPQILRRFGYFNAAFVSAWPLVSHLTGFSHWFQVYDQDMKRSYQFLSSSRFAEDVTPRAISWLEDQRVEPFFLWVHYFDPHAPYHLRKRFADPATNGHATTPPSEVSAAMTDRIRRYDSEIGYVDHHLGLLLRALDKAGVTDSTLLVLTSDHGESLGEHDYVGHGRHLYDSILRVPLIVRYPGHIKPGKVIATPVSLLDVTPTILELSGLSQRQPPIPANFVGRSLAGAIQNGSSLQEHPVRFLTFAGKKGWTPSWLSFSWAWLRYPKLPLRLGWLNGPTKSVWTPREKSLLIYDLASDLHELDPLSVSSENDRFAEETSALEIWFKATDLTEADMKRAERDEEILKSLGYTQ